MRLFVAITILDLLVACGLSAQRVSDVTPLLVCKDTMISEFGRPAPMYMYHNNALQITVCSEERLTPAWTGLLRGRPNRSGWRSYSDTAIHAVFQHPPGYEVLKDTQLANGLPSFVLVPTRRATEGLGKPSNSTPAVHIYFNAGTFEQQAGDRGYLCKGGIWYSEMYGVSDIATHITGDRLEGLIGQQEERVSLDAGGLATSTSLDYFICVEYRDHCFAVVNCLDDHLNESWIVEIAHSLQSTE